MRLTFGSLVGGESCVQELDIGQSRVGRGGLLGNWWQGSVVAVAVGMNIRAVGHGLIARGNQLSALGSSFLAQRAVGEPTQRDGKACTDFVAIVSEAILQKFRRGLGNR